MAGKKRELDVSEIDEEVKDICVHGVPVAVSPKKKSRKNESITYFDGEVSDGKKTVRVVSFNPSLHSKMKEAEESLSNIAFSHADIKKSGRSGEPEVFLTSKSEVGASLRKVGVVKPRESKPAIKIADLSDVSVGQSVNVILKIVSVEDSQKITKKDGNELVKQDVSVGDCSGCCRMVLWEQDVDSLEEGKTYCFEGVTVKKYDMHKYLSFGQNGTKCNCEDLGEVSEEDVLSLTEDIASSGRCVTGEIFVCYFM